MDALDSPLQIRERPFLLGMNRRGEQDVSDVVERVVGVPRHHHQELRFAEVGHNGRIFGPLAEGGVGDEEHVDAVRALREEIFDR